MQIAAVAACHCGADAAAETDLKPLRDWGSPLMDTIDVLPYPQMNTLLDDGTPRGARNYWKDLDTDEMDRGRAAYGPNWDRLVELKGRYDPDNLFRMNVNIPPGG